VNVLQQQNSPHTIHMFVNGRELAQWLARQTVIGELPVDGRTSTVNVPIITFSKKCLNSLLSTGWFQEHSWTWCVKRNCFCHNLAIRCSINKTQDILSSYSYRHNKFEM